jgi:hypothetical protein
MFSNPGGYMKSDSGLFAYITSAEVSTTFAQLSFGTLAIDRITTSFSFTSGVLTWTNDLFPGGVQWTLGSGEIGALFSGSMPTGYVPATLTVLQITGNQTSGKK